MRHWPDSHDKIIPKSGSRKEYGSPSRSKQLHLAINTTLGQYQIALFHSPFELVFRGCCHF